MNTRLTKDADKLLCILYKDYLIKVKNGLSKSKSSYFGDSNEITTKYLPNCHPEDVAKTCWELHSSGYLTCSSGDDLANHVTFTPNGIAYMENRFKNNLKEVIDCISKFIP